MSFLIFTILKITKILNSLDIFLSDLVSINFPVKHWWIYAISETASLPFITALILLIGGLMYAKNGNIYPTIKMILYYVFLLLLTGIIKAIVRWPRPEGMYDMCMSCSFLDYIHRIDEFSYPSGHSSRAGFVAAAINNVFKKRYVKVLTLTYAVFISITRILLSLHWTSDVIGGLLLGYSMYYLYDFISSRQIKRSSS